MRIVFMGSPEFGVPALERLAGSKHQVAAVYTQPDRPAGRGRRPEAPPVKSAALRLGLPVRQPPHLREPSEVARLKELAPDLIVVAAFGQMLPESVLGIPDLGCLNIHPSLLPRHRGAAPVAYAVLAGDNETGVSIMLMDAGMDTGPVVAQERIPIEPEDTTGSLTDKLSRRGALLLLKVLPAWARRELTPQPQDSALATYSQPLRKEDGAIDWGLPAVTLWRRVRAFQPWPGCYTQWQGKVVKIIKAFPIDGDDGAPGTVRAMPFSKKMGTMDSSVGVQTGQGLLALVELQIEGKKPMRISEFVRGQRGFIGSRLSS
ncbi:MAG: methionyl-tRNA formyltransferase [Dehalococcoidia bacterium]|nr:methionyl-tRNA formyltransferase [Dehalococcoidia bacterium]